MGQGCALPNHYGFNVEEFTQAMNSELAAVAGSLYSAEGEARIGSDHRIDEDHAGFDFVDESLLLSGVAGPGAGSEAEGGVIRELDGGGEIVDAKERCDGAEEFFA